MRSWFEKIKSKNFIFSLLIVILQLIAVFLKNYSLPVVWIDIILLFPIIILAYKKIITPLLPLGFVSVVICLTAEPGGLGLWFLPLVMLIPMFIIIKDISKRSTLVFYGFWIGILMAIGILSWVWDAMVIFWEVHPILAFPLFIMIVIFVALPFPIFFVLTRILYENIRIPLGILGAFIYALTEFWLPVPFHIRLAFGYTWTPLMIQIADIGGMWGISLIIALVNGLLFTIFENVISKKQKKVIGWSFILIGILGFEIFYGLISIHKYKPSEADSSLNVAMIQPVSPLKIMNADHSTKMKVAENLLRLSMEALVNTSTKPDLLIWPEGSASFSYNTPEFNSEFTDAIKQLLSENPVNLLVQDIEFIKLIGTSRIGYFNHISLIGPDGNYLGGYRKNILLPFAEYLPGEKMFPFLRKYFRETRSILNEDKKTSINGPGGNFIPLICYEIIFENYVREFVNQNNEAKYIVNLTNDRWYGIHQQPQQHLSFAVFRAVETRLPVIRGTNSGISAIIDARGIILPGYRTSVMKETTLSGTIYPKSYKTFYCKFGDIIPRFILTPILVLGLISVYLLKQKKRKLSEGKSHKKHKRKW